MTTAILVSILMTLVAASTPILLAALGELVTEKAGVLNLGVEGMMLCGAVAGFAVAFSTGSTMLGLVAAMAAGVATAMVFAVLTLSLTANQVATGLALTIFGIGASSLIGAGFVGRTLGLTPPETPGFARPSTSRLPPSCQRVLADRSPCSGRPSSAACHFTSRLVGFTLTPLRVTSCS